MHVIQRSLVRVLLVAFPVVGLVSALAQQTTGAPGTPNATTTMDSRYLPTPPNSAGGVINMRAQDGRP